MLARSFRRAPFQFKSAFRRPLNTNGSSATPPRFAARPILLASGGIVAGSLLYMSTRPTIHNDAAELRAYQLRHEPRSLSELARTYFVYTMCSFPTLVDWSPLILQLLTSIPGVKQITEAFVKETFFAQFVGGPTAEACLSLLERLRAENKGLLFAYSVEVDEHEATGQSSEKNAEEPVYKRIRNEMLNAIDIASAFDDTHSTVTSSPNGRRTWVAIKMSAMVPDHEAFIKFSTYLVQSAQKAPYSPRIEFPGYPRSDDVDILTKSCPTPGVPGADMAEIFDLYQDLRKICQRAQEKHVRIILDAEYSWYQPALDCITFALMREFNKVPEEGSGATNHTSPLIYGTFQAYLRRAPELLARSLEDARNGGYALGVKLVRGAYHEQENAMHHVPGSPSISPEPHSPIWPSKEETDKSYNTCVLMLTQAIAADVKSGPVPKIGVLFGSHNWDSVRLILNELQRLGLATPTGTLPPEEQVQGHEVPDESVLQLPEPVTDRVTLGQLFGMSDGLTNYIVARTRSASPFVIKYVPYGALSEVMPYLARRAIENKSVLGNGGANEERSQAWSQIRKRFGLS